MTRAETEMTVKKEVPVEICDECGIAEEEGELVMYVPAEREELMDNEELDVLHYHRGCLDRLGARSVENPVSFQDVARDEVDGDRVFVFDENDVAGLVCMTAGLVSSTFMAAYGYLVFAAILGGLCIMVLFGAILNASDTAAIVQQKVDELRQGDRV